MGISRGYWIQEIEGGVRVFQSVPGWGMLRVGDANKDLGGGWPEVMVWKIC